MRVIVAVLCLAGCGEMGLESLIEHPVRPEGEDAAGTDSTGDDDSTHDAPVVGSLEGRTYAVDLLAVTFVEPVGAAAMASLLDSSILLFHVEAEHQSWNTFKMKISVSASSGAAATCDGGA